MDQNVVLWVRVGGLMFCIMVDTWLWQSDTICSGEEELEWFSYFISQTATVFADPWRIVWGALEICQLSALLQKTVLYRCLSRILHLEYVSLISRNQWLQTSIDSQWSKRKHFLWCWTPKLQYYIFCINTVMPDN